MIQSGNLDQQIAELVLSEPYNPDRHRFLDDDEACMWLVEWLRERGILVTLDGLTATLYRRPAPRLKAERLASATGHTARLALVKACVRVGRENPQCLSTRLPVF